MSEPSFIPEATPQAFRDPETLYGPMGDDADKTLVPPAPKREVFNLSLQLQVGGLSARAEVNWSSLAPLPWDSISDHVEEMETRLRIALNALASHTPRS